MSLDYLVKPGEILKDYLEEFSYTQKEFAIKIKVSERHLSNIINGKASITTDFALKLDNVFDGYSAEYWLEMENGYQLALKREGIKRGQTLKELAKKYRFADVFRGQKMSLKEQSEKMLKILGVSSYDEAEKNINNMEYSFSQDSGSIYAIYIWLKQCEKEIVEKKVLDTMNEYKKDNLLDNLPKFKKILYSIDFSAVCKNLERLLKRIGIGLVINEAVVSSKIRGATTFINGHPVIFLSTRYKRLDTIYFAFMHEINHVINEDYKKNKYQLTLTKDDLLEKKSNEFARDFFINRLDLDKFAKSSKSIEIKDILIFSKEHNVIPDIVIGFLKHDKQLEQFEYNSYITKI